MTLWILDPGGNFVPSIVVGSFTLPMCRFQVSTSVKESKVMRIGCCLSFIALGLSCRLGCFVLADVLLRVQVLVSDVASVSGNGVLMPRAVSSLGARGCLRGGR